MCSTRASVLATGYLLDRWILRGASFNRAYKTALCLSSAGVGLCLITSSMVTGLAGAAVILLLTGVLDGLNSPSNPSVTQTFAGPLATGRWMGIQNAVGNVAGMTAPVVTGYLVQQSGHYTSSLIVAGVSRCAGRRVARRRAGRAADRLGAEMGYVSGRGTATTARQGSSSNES